MEGDVCSPKGDHAQEQRVGPTTTASQVARTTTTRYASGGIVEEIVAFQRAETDRYREALEALQTSIAKLVMQRSTSSGLGATDGREPELLSALMGVVQDNAARQSQHVRALSDRVRQLEDERLRPSTGSSDLGDNDVVRSAAAEQQQQQTPMLPPWHVLPTAAVGGRESASLSERRLLQETLPPLLSFFEDHSPLSTVAVSRRGVDHGTPTAVDARHPVDRDVSITSLQDEHRQTSLTDAPRAVRFASSGIVTSTTRDEAHVVASPNNMAPASVSDSMSLPSSSPAGVPAQKYAALKTKYFAQKRRAQEASAARVAATFAWRRVWLQSAALRGTWRCVVRMSPEGAVAACRVPSRSSPRGSSVPRGQSASRRLDPSYLSSSGQATFITCGAEEGPRKARVDGYIPGSMGCWEAAGRLIEEHMAVCECGGHSLVVVVGGPSTGRASLSHDIAVQALSSMAQYVDSHRALLPSSSLRVTCTMCDADDVWSVPVRPIHRDATHSLARSGSDAATNTMSVLFHERRAKFAGCHMLLSIDVVVDDNDDGISVRHDVSHASDHDHTIDGAERRRVLCRFTAVDVAHPSAPNNDEGAAVGYDLQHALLSMVASARSAFLQRWSSTGRGAHDTAARNNGGAGDDAVDDAALLAYINARSPAQRGESSGANQAYYESSYPLCSLLHQLQGGEEAAVTQSTLVACVGPHAADAATWETVRFAAKVRQAAMRGAPSGASIHNHTEATAHATPPSEFAAQRTGTSTPPRPLHPFDADVLGRLEFDHEM